MALQDELNKGCGEIGNADVATRILRIKISSSVVTLTGANTFDADLSIGN
jgi:hypothetical protein